MILVANCGKISSAKAVPKFNSAFLPKLATVLHIVFPIILPKKIHLIEPFLTILLY